MAIKEDAELNKLLGANSDFFECGVVPLKPQAKQGKKGKKGCEEMADEDEE